MLELTVRQKAFGDYYVELGNAEQAAIKAGYSERYARGNAHKLVAHGGIKTYIDEQLKKIEDDRIASAAEVMKFLTSVMRNEVTEEVVVVEGKGEGTSTAKRVKKDIPAKDRNKAAELLGKRYGMFTEKINIGGAVPVVISGDAELED